MLLLLVFVLVRVGVVRFIEYKCSKNSLSKTLKFKLKIIMGCFIIMNMTYLCDTPILHGTDYYF